jgi:hypothetical protein
MLFLTTVGTFDRFILRYVDKSLSVVNFADPEESISVSVKTNSYELIQQESIDEVTIYNLAGREIYQNEIMMLIFQFFNLLVGHQVLLR